LIRVKWVLTGVYLVVSSSSRRPTWLTITIDSTDVATMRTIKPTAMATIRLLIDCRIIDPDSFRRFSVSVTEMAALPLGLADFAETPQDD
jgi:hypothetical protein